MYKAIKKAALVLTAAILTVGCTCDEQGLTQEREVNVTFRVGTDLYVTTDQMPTRSAISGNDLGDLVKCIGYNIYRDGELYKSGVTSYDPGTGSAPDDFGVFQEKLLPATYTVVFYAVGKNSDNVSLDGKDDLGKMTFTGYNCELFLYVDNILINSKTTDINLTLKRQSALMSVQITDDPIDEVDHLAFNISANYTYFPKPEEEYYNTRDVTKEWHTFVTKVVDGKLPVTNIYLLNPQNPTNMVLSIYDKNNELLGSQELQIPLYSNRRTVISGNLFSNLGDKPLYISIDDSWGSDVSYILE